MRTPVSSPPSPLSNCTPSSVATPSPPSASSFSTPCDRCEGLDLLAMAALEVAGANRGMDSNTDGKNNSNEKLVVVVKGGEDGAEGAELGSTPKRRRQMVTPSKFQDSIMQPWKRRTRRRRLSSPAE